MATLGAPIGRLAFPGTCLKASCVQNRSRSVARRGVGLYFIGSETWMRDIPQLEKRQGRGTPKFQIRGAGPPAHSVPIWVAGPLPNFAITSFSKYIFERVIFPTSFKSASVSLPANP